MKKGIKLFLIVALAASFGCAMDNPLSSEEQGPQIVWEDKVIKDDGETLITSTRTVFPLPEAARVSAGGEVWRVYQDVRKYYRQGGTLYMGGQLLVRVGVKNLAYNKTVGIRYTQNNWASYKNNNGYWAQHNSWNNTDEFDVFTDSDIQPYATVKYAIYFKANGRTYWDNNGGRNYSAQF